MRLNHLNLIVTNVANAVQFFEAYFDFVCTEIKGDNIVAVLTGADNFILVLMTNKEAQISYPTNFHIGFMLGNANQVKACYLKLKDGGISIGNEPGKIRDSFGFYFHFDNIMIEVGLYI